MHRSLSMVIVLLVAAFAAPALAESPGAAEPVDLALVSALGARAELTALGATGTADAGHDPSKMFLLSLAIPGAGQAAQQESRGCIYVVAEVVLWAGFFALNDKGLDERTKYENYADAHWDFEGYSAWYDTACVDCQDCGYDCRPLAEYGTQEYYEDIGKYDTYWGWWSPSESGPDDLAVRSEYVGMRHESNVHLRQARYSMTAAFLNHLVSSVDSFLSARRRRESGGERVGGTGAPGPRIMFDTAGGGTGLRCALVVSY